MGSDQHSVHCELTYHNTEHKRLSFFITFSNDIKHVCRPARFKDLCTQSLKQNLNDIFPLHTILPTHTHYFNINYGKGGDRKGEAKKYCA